MLSAKYLGRAIQQGGGEKGGHDSGEDARATGDLVRVKVGERWAGMGREGWRFEDGRLVKRGRGPGQGVGGDGDVGEGDLAEGMVERAFEGRRRKRRGGADEGGEIVGGDGGGLKAFLERGRGGEGAQTREHDLSVAYLEDGERNGLGK
ncbi:RNA exonuclease 3 [Teratosphaeriaceae sp. CCFEE 6253]|nr:RNA exonuclease 3 [Teratosphaeriaceae sp. CCFEE 6253]